MKFRRTCTSCNSTFFSPDRKAAFCGKCLKKRIVKHVPAEVKAEVQPARVLPRPIPRPAAPPTAMFQKKRKPPRPPKSAALTPEIKEKIIEAYHDEFGDQKGSTREIHNQIANKLWVKRQLVADVIRELQKTEVVITSEIRERAIEMYKRFVESGHRPDGGRRRAISTALGIPFKQIIKVIRDWSISEYSKSPTPHPTREQLFEIEKLYWRELEQQRYGLMELPAKIAEQLGFITRWQVLRWLDVLHDDERPFDKVPDPSPEDYEKILAVYREYLGSSAPPDQGLHYTIAGMLEKVSPRQVHKVLQHHRHKLRAEYPLL